MYVRSGKPTESRVGLLGDMEIRYPKLENVFSSLVRIRSTRGVTICINLTVLSNVGRLDLGVLACCEAVPDPWEIAEGFAHAVTDLTIAAEKHASSERA